MGVTHTPLAGERLQPLGHLSHSTIISIPTEVIPFFYTSLPSDRKGLEIQGNSTMKKSMIENPGQILGFFRDCARKKRFSFGEQQKP